MAPPALLRRHPRELPFAHPPPHLTAEYATEHDAAVARCLATLLEQGDAPLPSWSLDTARLAQRFGGLGLRSASSDRFTAHWASWCDTMPVIQARAPAAAARLRAALQGDGALPSSAAATPSPSTLTRPWVRGTGLGSHLLRCRRAPCTRPR